MLSPKDAAMSKIREEAIEKIKTESGLSEEEFQEILDSFHYGSTYVDNGQFRFRFRGHEIVGYGGVSSHMNPARKDGVSGMIYSISIDGKKVPETQLREFEAKFGPVIKGLSMLSNKDTEEVASREEVDDLLR